MQFKTLKEVPIDVLCSAFNAAFADYAISLQMTAEQLAAKIRAEYIDLSLSVGVFDNEKLVGFTLFAIDEVDGSTTIWDGGTGVVPQYRGQRLTQKVFDYALPILKNTGAKRILLEVLEKNTVAYNIYEKLGFNTTRLLHAYHGVPNAVTKASHNIEELSDYDADALLSLGNAKPGWQQMNNRLKGMGDAVKTYVIKDGQNIAAYIHYTPGRGRIVQFGVDVKHRRNGMGTALFQHVYDGSTQLSVVNVDEHADDMIAFLNTTGLELFISQYEMEMTL